MEYLGQGGVGGGATLERAVLKGAGGGGGATLERAVLERGG